MIPSISKKILLLILLTTLLGGFAPHAVADNAKVTTTMQETCSGPTIVIRILDAYYADTDGDGLDDDVHSLVRLDLLCANRMNFYYQITLTLPSGMDFTYTYQINTRLTLLYMDNFFYDHALEPGDYRIDVEVLLKTGGVAYGATSVIFDPPGHIPADPDFRLVVTG